MVEHHPTATIDCFATITAIRGPNIEEVKRIGNHLMMNFVVSSNGIQIGNFITPYNPTCEIGNVFRIKLSLTKIEREEFLAEHGFTEVQNSMNRFIV